MRVVALSLLFFFALHLGTALGVACKTPTGKPSLLATCDCTGTAISCNNRALTSIPGNLSNCTQYAPSGILSLYFSNNLITYIPNNTFAGFTSVTSIQLNNNRLHNNNSGEEFPEGFVSSTKLDPLGNAYGLRLPPGEGVPGPYTNWTSVFSGLYKLKTIYLNNNRLTLLPNITFANNTNLTDIRLNNCHLTGIENGTFHNKPYLQDIRLQGNYLTEDDFPYGIFQGIPQLYQVYVNNNILKRIPDGLFRGIPRLTYLYLNNNFLTNLSANTLTGCTNLYDIRLNNNLLTSIDAGFFDGLSGLSIVYMSVNKLLSIDSGWFAGRGLKLVSLFFQSNCLTFVPLGIFNGLTSLATLQFGNNLITSLPNGTFTGLTSLNSLGLPQNYLGLSGYLGETTSANVKAAIQVEVSRTVGTFVWDTQYLPATLSAATLASCGIILSSSPSPSPSAFPSPDTQSGPTITSSTSPSDLPSPDTLYGSTVTSSVSPTASVFMPSPDSMHGVPSTTSSVSPSVSPFFSPSPNTLYGGSTFSPSVSPTLTPSVFMPSPDALYVAPTFSTTGSPSVNPSALPSITPSPSAQFGTMTFSVSSTLTPSVFMPSPDPLYVAPTLSTTSSPSVSPSALPSVTPSPSAQFGTMTFSVSSTLTPSVFMPSPDPLFVGLTFSTTSSPSVSPFVSTSVVPTFSTTGSPSVSPSAFHSVSTSPSVTSSISPTAFETTITTSNSPSVSRSVLPTPSDQYGHTVSSTSLYSFSPTVSLSPNAPPSVSPTVSPTVLPTVSPLPDFKHGPTNATSASTFPSPFSFPSPDTTASPTISPSVSPLPVSPPPTFTRLSSFAFTPLSSVSSSASLSHSSTSSASPSPNTPSSLKSGSPSTPPSSSPVRSSSVRVDNGITLSATGSSLSPGHTKSPSQTDSPQAVPSSLATFSPRSVQSPSPTTTPPTTFTATSLTSLSATHSPKSTSSSTSTVTPSAFRAATPSTNPSSPQGGVVGFSTPSVFSSPSATGTTTLSGSSPRIYTNFSFSIGGTSKEVMQADNGRLGSLIAPLASELLGLTPSASSAVAFSDTVTLVSNSTTLSSSLLNSTSTSPLNFTTSNSSTTSADNSSQSTLSQRRRLEDLCGGQNTTYLVTTSTLAQVQLSASTEEMSALILSEGLTSNTASLTQDEFLAYLSTAISKRLSRSLNALSSSNSSTAVTFLSGMRACSGNTSFSFTVLAVTTAAGLSPVVLSPSPVASAAVNSSSPSPPYFIIGVVLGVFLIICLGFVWKRHRKSRNLEGDQNKPSVSESLMDTTAPTSNLMPPATATATVVTLEPLDSALTSISPLTASEPLGLTPSAFSAVAFSDTATEQNADKEVDTHALGLLGVILREVEVVLREV